LNDDDDDGKESGRRRVVVYSSRCADGPMADRAAPAASWKDIRNREAGVDHVLWAESSYGSVASS
jgi:hypothetical protein